MHRLGVEMTWRAETVTHSGKYVKKLLLYQKKKKKTRKKEGKPAGLSLLSFLFPLPVLPL